MAGGCDLALSPDASKVLHTRTRKCTYSGVCFCIACAENAFQVIAHLCQFSRGVLMWPGVVIFLRLLLPLDIGQGLSGSGLVTPRIVCFWFGRKLLLLWSLRLLRHGGPFVCDVVTGFRTGLLFAGPLERFGHWLELTGAAAGLLPTAGQLLLFCWLPTVGHSFLRWRYGLCMAILPFASLQWFTMQKCLKNWKVCRI